MRKKGKYFKENMSEKLEKTTEESRRRKKLGIPWCYFMYIRLFP